MADYKRITSIEFADGIRYNVRDGLPLLVRRLGLNENVIQRIKYIQLPNGEKYKFDFDGPNNIEKSKF